MLFRKKINRSCTYCLHSVQLEDGQILCHKKGIKTPEDKCFRFKYDACKRIPKKVRAFDFSQFDNDDFSL